jgi:hypothetical protein
MDLFFKVPSIMPADDICDEISGTELLSLFRIDPTPTFIASFYYSLVAVSTRPQVQQEMEEIFHQKLIECKSCASSLCEQTRSRFHEVEEKCMVRGGKTFREYLSAKHVDSWDKIGFDNVLGEVSLCSQVWKLNIALIWRYNNVWRLFVCAHGGASPINTILYAKTRVQVDAEGRTSFAAGTARRFFSIDPINDEWFESSLFTQSIPESVPQEPELPAAVQFRKHLDKEFALQSVIECEGAASSDEMSEITADASESDFRNSFVDEESVSQGSFPTPPEIKAIPVTKVVQVINDGMTAPLRSIRRRRVVVSSDEEEGQTAKSNAANGSKPGAARDE